MIGLTADEHIGAGVAADIKIVEGYVRGLPGFDADHDLKKLTGAQVTPANIRQAIEDLDVQPTDVLFCYYAGHGAYDADLNADDDPSGGHFFQIPGGDLRRADLLGRLTDKGARLTVLISETCNAAGDYNPPDPNAGDSVPRRTAARTRRRRRRRSRRGPSGRCCSTSPAWWMSAAPPATSTAWPATTAASPPSAWCRPWRTRQVGRRLSFPPARPDGKVALWTGTVSSRMRRRTSTRCSRSRIHILAQPEPDDEAAKEFRQALRYQDDLRPQTFQLDIRPLGQAEDDKDFVPPPPPDSIHCVFFLPSAARIP